jgi:hypothetical protein
MQKTILIIGAGIAGLSGRNVTQIICRADKRPFVTSIP